MPPPRRWPQAAAAARNSRKRLPTNQEWQMAALGTPNSAPCGYADDLDEIRDTGTIAGCVSDTGAFDMVGNAAEWVAEWVPRSKSCNGVAVFDGQGENCFFGVATDVEFPQLPNTEVGALIRGFNGVYAVNGRRPPGSPEGALGFRAAR